MKQKLQSKLRSNQNGFTLLEVLIVVAIIAILAGIVILAINPTKQLGAARNAKRQADLNTLVNAVYQYAIDNNGTMPPSLATTTKGICFDVVDATNCPTASNINLSADLVGATAKYLASMPCDPTATCTTTNNTKYTIIKDPTTGRITVSTTVFDSPAIANFTVTR